MLVPYLYLLPLFFKHVSCTILYRGNRNVIVYVPYQRTETYLRLAIIDQYHCYVLCLRFLKHVLTCFTQLLMRCSPLGLISSRYNFPHLQCMEASHLSELISETLISMKKSTPSIIPATLLGHTGFPFFVAS